jgi:hypothetical protein
MTQAQTIDCGTICEATAGRQEGRTAGGLIREWWRLWMTGVPKDLTR